MLCCSRIETAHGTVGENFFDLLRSVSIGTDGWSLMTVGIINTSVSVSSPDVTDESFSVDLIAVDIFLRFQIFQSVTFP